jgi:DNA modification methylase
LSGGRAGAHIGSKQFNANGSKLLGLARVADIVSISTRLNADSNGLNDHPAPFPPALAEWVGKLICPPGGTILDPFSGSGSTGVAAVRNGWDYIGIDAVSEYVEMSRLRLAHE